MKPLWWEHMDVTQIKMWEQNHQHFEFWKKYINACLRLWGIYKKIKMTKYPINQQTFVSLDYIQIPETGEGWELAFPLPEGIVGNAAVEDMGSSQGLMGKQAREYVSSSEGFVGNWAREYGQSSEGLVGNWAKA